MMAVCVAPCFGMQKIKKLFLGDQLEKSIDDANRTKVKKALEKTSPLEINSKGITYLAQACLKEQTVVANIEAKDELLSKLSREVSEENIKNQIFQCCKVCPKGYFSSTKEFNGECKALKELALINPETAKTVSSKLAMIIRESGLALEVNDNYQVMINGALSGN